VIVKFDKKATRDGKPMLKLPSFNLTGSYGVIAARMAQTLALVLPPLPADPAYDYAPGTGSMVRMQIGTGAGGRGAHRRWKKRRAAGRY
jgi:hypothetical protein